MAVLSLGYVTPAGLAAFGAAESPSQDTTFRQLLRHPATGITVALALGLFIARRRKMTGTATFLTSVASDAIGAFLGAWVAVELARGGSQA